MMTFETLIAQRRSHRAFSSEAIDAEQVRLLLRAALMSPTSKNQRAWKFVVVDDALKIEKLSDVKEAGSQFLKNAPLAIVVLGNAEENDCWIEDGSIAAFAMQLQAEALGLGSCWVQIRDRHLSDGTDSEAIVRGILDIPNEERVLCVLAFGHPADVRKPQNEDRLKWERVVVSS